MIRKGTISFSQSSFGTPPNVFSAASASAVFAQLPFDPLQFCLSSTTGACTVNRCPLTPPPDAGAAMPMYESAGDLTLEAPGIDGGLALTFGSSRTYSANLSGAAFSPGDTVRVRATGAAVSAFSNSLTAPGTMTLTAPALTPGMTYALDRTVPLTVSWTSSGSSEVQVTISSITPQHSTSIVCKASSAAGTLTVPTSALSQLDLVPAMPPQGTFGSMGVSTSTSTDFIAGAYGITFTATNGGTSVLMSVQ